MDEVFGGDALDIGDGDGVNVLGVICIQFVAVARGEFRDAEQGGAVFNALGA